VEEGTRSPQSGWELVTLGVTVPRSYFCICCLTFDGTGMHRAGVTYCLHCWEQRQQGDPCQHGADSGDARHARKAG
jgi:hypothetical protein